MAIRERLIYAIEIVTDKAQAGIRGFRQSVSEAEGTVGKFRAGASSAFATVQANAGALALGAGGAIAAFGAKSVKAFQETALAAGKLSDATGLTVEDASRLQEVAGDLGVSTEAVAGSLVRLQKAVASNSDAVQELGIETKRTKDGQVDVNATMLDAIGRLNGVQDANKRALLAAQLFGKGFADSAELLLGDADEIKKRLDGVADAQVISPAQLARARKFRDQMDGLADSLKQVELTVGDQLVPVIGELAAGLVEAEKAAGKVNDVLGNLPGDISLGGINRGQLGALGAFVRAVKEVKDRFDDGGDAAETFSGQVDRMADSVNAAAPDLGELSDEAKATADAAAEAAEHTASLGDKAANAGPKIGDMAGALDDAREHLADLNQEARDNALNELADAVKAVGDAVDAALGDVADRLDLKDLVDDITDQFAEIAEAQKHVTEDGEEGVRNYNRSVRDLQRQLLRLLESIKGIPPDKKVRIATEIETGSLDDLYRILADLTKGVTVPVSFTEPVAMLAGFDSANGIFTPGAAPSAPIFSGVSTPAPLPVGSLDQRTIINNYPVGTTPTTQWQNDQIDLRRNGPR